MATTIEGRTLSSAARFSLADLPRDNPPPADLLKTGTLTTEVIVWEKLWVVAMGRELLTLRQHPANFVGIVFSTNGHLLVTASRLSDLKVWDATPLDRNLPGQ
jgi:hypothetical protein